MAPMKVITINLTKETSQMTQLLPQIPVERLENAIVLIRGEKVMLDRDLAELYGVETRALNQERRRNLERFPPDSC
jgi:ORF6N domain